MNTVALVLFTLASQVCMQAAPTQTDAPRAAQPAQRVVPTVSLDPEKPFPIVGWWSNGTQMLEVAPDGAYRLYESQNQYRKPMEVGRWHRQNHAAFWLEPYTMRKEEQTRVPLSIIDDSVAITVRKFKPMNFIDGAPMAPEDLFIGLWSGQGGSLDLQPTMRYHYVAPKSAGEGQPVVISSHKGEWRLRDGKVELLPDSPSVTAMLLEPEARAEVPQRGATDAKGAHGDGKEADREPLTFLRLLSVEGPLERIVQRPTVGPGRGEGTAEKRETQRPTG